MAPAAGTKGKAKKKWSKGKGTLRITSKDYYFGN
jgi:hypothetical protein